MRVAVYGYRRGKAHHVLHLQHLDHTGKAAFERAGIGYYQLAAALCCQLAQLIFVYFAKPHRKYRQSKFGCALQHRLQRGGAYGFAAFAVLAVSYHNQRFVVAWCSGQRTQSLLHGVIQARATLRRYFCKRCIYKCFVGCEGLGERYFTIKSEQGYAVWRCQLVGELCDGGLQSLESILPVPGSCLHAAAGIHNQCKR